jgi:transcriptional regulator with XRE-family HTH domain
MKHGEMIKNARKRAGITQQELANKLGLTQNYIALIEGNKRIPSSDTFLKICEILNISDGSFQGEAQVRKEVKSLLDRLGADEVVRKLVDLLGEDRINKLLSDSKESDEKNIAANMESGVERQRP